MERNAANESQADQLAASRRRAADAVLSALEEAEVQGIPVATLRAMKMGRPFRVKPTGLTAKGFAGFKATESVRIRIGRELLSQDFPKKAIQQFLDGFSDSLTNCTLGFHDVIQLCITRDGELLQFNGMKSMPDLETFRAVLSGCVRHCFLDLSLILEDVLERRAAFLERRAYKEPESVRAERERNIDGILKALADPTLRYKFWEDLLAPYCTPGGSAREEFSRIEMVNGITRFQHKASGQELAFDTRGQFYRYKGGKYVRATFSREEFDRKLLKV